MSIDTAKANRAVKVIKDPRQVMAIRAVKTAVAIRAASLVPVHRIRREVRIILARLVR